MNISATIMWAKDYIGQTRIRAIDAYTHVHGHTHVYRSERILMNGHGHGGVHGRTYGRLNAHVYQSAYHIGIAAIDIASTVMAYIGIAAIDMASIVMAYTVTGLNSQV